MDQNNIILVLLLIAVLVAFYAIYLGMENSKKIKKINLELNDALRLVDETTRLKREIQETPQNLQSQTNETFDEYPTLEEINSSELNRENLKQHESEMPLDNNLKEQIENLENMSEEELLNLERRLQNEDADELMEFGNVPNLEEINRHNEDDERVEEQTKTVEEDEHSEDEHSEDEHSEEAHVEDTHVEDTHSEEAHVEDTHSEEAHVEDTHSTEAHVEDTHSTEASNGDNTNAKYPELGDLTEGILNEYNCEELRDICKREELRTRGRKSELVERISKKQNSLQ